MELEQLTEPARKALLIRSMAWCMDHPDADGQLADRVTFTAGWLAALEYVAEQLGPHGITL